MLRNLVGIADPSEVTDFTSSRLGIHSLRIPLLANLQGGIDKNFYKMIGTNHVSHIVASSAIRTNCSTNHRTAMTDDLSSHKPNPTNFYISVLFTKPQSLRNMISINRAIK